MGKSKKITDENTVESKIFYRTQQLITIRKKLTSISDFKNINWLHPHNIHVAGFIRNNDEKQVYCLFNFKNEDSYVTWYTFKNNAYQSNKLFDHWSQESHIIGADNEYLIIPPYSFCIMEVIG